MRVRACPAAAPNAAVSRCIQPHQGGHPSTRSAHRPRTKPPSPCWRAPAPLCHRHAAAAQLPSAGAAVRGLPPPTAVAQPMLVRALPHCDGHRGMRSARRSWPPCVRSCRAAPQGTIFPLRLPVATHQSGAEGNRALSLPSDTLSPRCHITALHSAQGWPPMASPLTRGPPSGTRPHLHLLLTAAHAVGGNRHAAPLVVTRAYPSIGLTELALGAPLARWPPAVQERLPPTPAALAPTPPRPLYRPGSLSPVTISAPGAPAVIRATRPRHRRCSRPLQQGGKQVQAPLEPPRRPARFLGLTPCTTWSRA